MQTTSTVRPAILFSLVVPAWFTAVSAFGFDGQETAFQRSILDNGLTVITQTDPASAITVIEIVIKGGSSAEPAGQAGISLLTTRLAVDIQDSDTGRDFMVKALQSSLTSRDDDAVIHLEFLTEFAEPLLTSVVKMIKDPLFTDIRIGRLIESMNYQHRLQADAAGAEAHFAQREALFGGSGYGGNVFGTEESLDSLKPRDVRNFYEQRFRAGNIIVVAVSDLTPDALKSLIERHFSSLRPGRPTDTETGSVVNDPPYPLRTLEKAQQQSVVSCSFALPSLSRRDYARISLIENVLGRGAGSQLWELRSEKKLAYSVSSRVNFFRRSGLLEAYLKTDASKTESAHESLGAALKDFWERGMTAEEFAAGQAVLRVDFLRTIEMKAGRASALGFFESSGLGADFFGRFLDELSSLTLDEVNAEIKRLMDPARASWVIVGPKHQSS